MRGLSVLTTMALSLCLVFASHVPNPNRSEQPRKPRTGPDAIAIEELNKQIGAAYKAGKVEAILAFYTDDAVEMPPNRPIYTDKNAIRQRLQTALERYRFELTIHSDEIRVAGDWAFDRGTYTISRVPVTGGQKNSGSGKYISILQRQPDGSWKRARFIWNTDNPD